MAKTIREWKDYDPTSWVTGTRELDGLKCACGTLISFAELNQKLTDSSRDSGTTLDWHCECGVLTEFEVHAIPEFHAYRQSRPA